MNTTWFSRNNDKRHKHVTRVPWPHFLMVLPLTIRPSGWEGGKGSRRNPNGCFFSSSTNPNGCFFFFSILTEQERAITVLHFISKKISILRRKKRVHFILRKPSVISSHSEYCFYVWTWQYHFSQIHTNNPKLKPTESTMPTSSLITS